MSSLEPIAVAPQSQLVLALRATDDGLISINRIEVLSDEISLTFADRGTKPLWETLRGDFRRFVEATVTAHSGRPGLIFLEDTRLQFGTLSLLGCKILSTPGTNGRCNLILRFPYVVGDINELFRMPSVKAPQRGEVLQKLLDLTSAFFMPLRDISLHLQVTRSTSRSDEAVRDAEGAFLEQFFNEKLREAEFAFFLLRRHIEDLDSGGIEAEKTPQQRLASTDARSDRQEICAGGVR